MYSSSTSKSSCKTNSGDLLKNLPWVNMGQGQKLHRCVQPTEVTIRAVGFQTRWKYFHLVWKPTALIVTSVGCTHRCNFCPCPMLTQGRFLRRSPELVLQELLDVDEEYIYAG